MRYHQALRELSGRHDEMVSMCEQIKYLKAEIRMQNEKLFFVIPRFWHKRSTKELESDLKKMFRSIKSKSREYLSFYRAARELKKVIGEVDSDRRKQLDAEAWYQRALNLAAIDFLSIGALQRSTWEFVLSFPDEIRSKILFNLLPQNREILFDQVGYISPVDDTKMAISQRVKQFK